MLLVLNALIECHTIYECPDLVVTSGTPRNYELSTYWWLGQSNSGGTLTQHGNHHYSKCKSCQHLLHCYSFVGAKAHVTVTSNRLSHSASVIKSLENRSHKAS